MRIGFSGRKETVSQTVPDNWKEMSLAFSRSMKEYFRRMNVDVIVCADQTFLKFLLAEENMLVPTGVRRVGTTIESNDKRKGVSLMLAAYIRKGDDNDALTSGILPPFIVFNGKTGATLDKRYSDWSRREGHSGSMNFVFA